MQELELETLKDNELEELERQLELETLRLRDELELELLRQLELETLKLNEELELELLRQLELLSESEKLELLDEEDPNGPNKM